MTRRAHAARRGSAFLLILFLMAVTTPLIVLLCNAHSTHVRCVHNHVSGRTALYVAEAGVHRAIAELLADGAWRTGFTDEAFPDGLGHTFTVTLADVDGRIEIASTSTTADGYAKTVTALVNGF